MIIRIILIILLLPQISFARPIIADLSLREIAIDSAFTGTDILLFGARNDAGDIVVVIRGPEHSYIVRKKEPVAGVWMNRKQVTFNNANGFYAVAANRSLDELRNEYLIQSLQIGMDNLQFQSSFENKETTYEFKEAFLSRKVKEKLYNPEIIDVSFIGDTLFRTILHFPDNIPRGMYSAEIYLFSDGQLMGIQTTPIRVYKKGLDAFVYDWAYKHPVIYGFAAVILALLAGWIAGHVFRKI